MAPVREALTSGWLFTLLLALLLEIALLLSLSNPKRWVWARTFILLIDGSLYLLWIQQFDHPDMRWIEKSQLFAMPLGFVALWTSRRTFSPCARRLLLVPLPLLLAAFAVFINGYSFPRGIGWEKLPTLGYRIIIDSQFSCPQERSLLLCWTCYSAVAAVVRVFSKTKRRAGSGFRFPDSRIDSILQIIHIPIILLPQSLPP